MHPRNFAFALGVTGFFAVASVAHTWTATLQSKDGSNISGSARVEQVVKPTADTAMPRDTTMPKDMKKDDGGYSATVTVTGAKPSTNLAWHVHQGKCAETPGAIVGRESDYAKLSTDDKGNGSVTSTLPISLVERSEYSLSVHRGPDKASGVSACGDLVLTKTQAGLGQ